MKIARRRRRRRRPLFLGAFFGVALATLAALPPNANAACIVTPAGTVNCNAGTATTDTANLDGARSPSSDRTQSFDNGAAIHGVVQSGVVVGGFGLQLAESGAAPRPITMHNQGEVTTTHAIDALHIDGNGGAIHYSGNGGVDNRTGTGDGLFVDNLNDDVSIVTGAGAIHGAAGIFASTTGAGALTIVTGSGLVSGTIDRGISASTENGALSVTVGSGGVTNHGADTPAIDLTSTNGDISVTAGGDVAGRGAVVGSGDVANIVGGVRAESNGTGHIAVGGSGTFFGQYGRGIWADESATGLGGILVAGSGATVSGTAALGCCSAIRAEIDNPMDSSNIVIDRSGNMIATTTISTAADPLASSDVHAFTFGNGNVIVATGAGATISNNGLFAIDAETSGLTSTGSIDVSTGVRSVLSAGGAGIFAVNSAFAIPVSAGSTIAVTNKGAIDSGPLKNPVGGFINEGAGATASPAGVIAGYDGGPVIGPAPTSGGYTSCGPIGCTTLTPSPNVTGTVSVVNNGAINAAGGDGVFAFNFGNGPVSVASNAPITVSGATSRDGIRAFSAEVGAISVTTTADVSAVNGSGIHTNSVGRGTTTIDVIAGVVEGGTSGVTAHAADGAIAIVNSGTIRNISGQPGALAIKTTGSAALLTNSAGGALTGAVLMTGAGASDFENAGVWNTLGASRLAGASALDNSGVLNALGATTLRGPTTLANSGVVNLADDATLTTRSYVGAGGILSISADLGGGNSPSGRLVIDGGSATGHTVVIVNNAGGRGAPTPGNGVEVVAAINGATTAPGAFTLGNRVAAGAYGYQLYDGGNAASGGDPNDQNWYLRSSYRPEVPLDAAIPALASRFGLDMLGTYHDRVGEDGVLDAATPGGPIEGQLSRLAGWGRLFGETGSGLVGGGPGSGFGLSGFQTGVDLYRRANADRSQDSTGLYLGAGAATANVNQATGAAAGDLSMDGYTLGGYWTHRGPSGWYLDAVAQATRFDNVAADSAAGQTLATDGWGFAASLEGGYPLLLGHGLTLEPQAQAIFERVSLHSGQDAYGLIDFGDADPLYGRIGARLSRLWTLGNGAAIETWGRANLWRAFGADASTTFATLSGADPVALATSLGGTWAQFGLGASSRVVRNVAVFASADGALAVDGARGHSYDGRIGVRIAW